MNLSQEVKEKEDTEYVELTKVDLVAMFLMNLTIKLLMCYLIYRIYNLMV